MNINEAIEKALDKEAIVFTGAGFSLGAINLNDHEFLRGQNLANFLALKAGSHEKHTLEDAAELFLEKLDEDALIKVIKEEFTAKQIKDFQRELMVVPWKRVYTTNYDDVVEMAYRANGKIINSATSPDDVHVFPKDQPICVHLNGYVEKLHRGNIGTELKLTDSSYVSASLEHSPWAVMFRQDIRLAKSIIFVGYSLYDLDIKRILNENPEIKEKCFFILGNSPDEDTLRRAERFGNVYKISTQEFAELVKERRQHYIPVENVFSPLSVKEYTNPTGTNITDEAFRDLLLLGTKKQEMIYESMSTHKRYYLERTAENRVFELFKKGHPVICILSDLGNGKSLFVDGLRVKGIENGFRVFTTNEHNLEAVRELQLIAQLPGKVMVIIEEYQNWLEEINIFRTNATANTLLILTARNSIHDVFLDELNRMAAVQSLEEIRLDVIDENELKWFVDIFNEFGLWGEWAAKSPEAKFRYLKNNCHGQFHSILLRVLESPDIGQHLRKICDALVRQRKDYDIILSAVILIILNQNPTIETLSDFWGAEVISSTRFRTDPIVKQLVDVKGNELLVKSPVAAQYLVRNLVDKAMIVSVLTKMAEKANANMSISPRYRDMMFNLVRFSNVQLVLPLENPAGAVISYYESIKNLRFCNKSPGFWLQYAIACLAINDLPRAKTYFKDAYGWAANFGTDTYQIDNHFARFLLTEAIQNLDKPKAMDNFRQARSIVDRQIKRERMYYPYRVATNYQGFINCFGSSLTPNELKEVSEAAQLVLDPGTKLPAYRKQKRHVRYCLKAMENVIARAEELIIKYNSKI